MKKFFLLPILIFLFIPISHADVTINITADRPGGWKDYPAQFHLTCVNPLTGEIVGSDWKIEPGESNSFKVDKNAHPQVVCWIFKYGGPMVSRKKIETRNFYKNGYYGNTLVIPSDSEIGECGDGEVSKYEACDTDSGCSLPKPKCYDCEFCGCGSDKDCPQPSGTPQCGFGKCSPQEKPYDRKNNCIEGVCVFSYKCRLDASCVDENETGSDNGIRLDGENVVHGSTEINQTQTKTLGLLEFETKITEMKVVVNGEEIEIEEGKFIELKNGYYFLLSDIGEVYEYYILSNQSVVPEINKKIFQNHGGADLEYMINAINSNIASVPPQLLSIFGDERINVYLEDGPNIFIGLKNNSVVELGTGKLKNPTMNVYTDIETILKIKEGDLGFTEAINSGRIKYKGVGFLNSIKFGVPNFLFRTYSFFNDLSKRFMSIF